MNHRNITATKINIIAMKCALSDTTLNLCHYEQIHEELGRAYSRINENGIATLHLTKHQKSELFDVCADYANEMEATGRKGFEIMREASKVLA